MAWAELGREDIVNRGKFREEAVKMADIMVILEVRILKKEDNLMETILKKEVKVDSKVIVKEDIVMLNSVINKEQEAIKVAVNIKGVVIMVEVDVREVVEAVKFIIKEGYRFHLGVTLAANILVLLRKPERVNFLVKVFFLLLMQSVTIIKAFYVVFSRFPMFLLNIDRNFPLWGNNFQDHQ